MNNLVERAFNRLRLASRVLLYGKLPFDTREQIPAITPKEVAQVRQFFPLDKFFIFGHARSGTTLLTRLIRLHSDVHCNYQGHFFTREPTIEALVNTPEIEAWFTRRSNRWNQGHDLSPVVLRVVVDFILEREAQALNAKVVGDKSPNSLLNGDAVKLLYKLYPDSKLIFIVRDGRDAAVSHRFQTFIDAPQHLSPQDWAIRADFETDPDPYLQGERSVFTETVIRNSAIGWVKNVHETDLYGQKLFGKQYISLRYEDLLDEPWLEMTRLWTFLGLDVDHVALQNRLKEELSRNPDKDWQKEKAEGLVGPLKKGKTGSWRELFTQRDKVIFNDIAAESLIAWGYEAGPAWETGNTIDG
jgi:hypothetical protein